ncbi:VOC family protein [Flavobacterium sp. NST-5]|uniref:VOC family protein n=1 Tax=Flavobacterium ichthyis TaxID=2698827 RepID=A0ABW9ZAV3_9FLAO|nr:VOC family protein [Flavobacterium ichthyis]NBL65261.1 VOC family protein [Flavobacterium ichthyis]
MAQINPYLSFNGNCEEVFLFYKSVFGGEFSYIGRFKDMPADENKGPMPDEIGNLIMHVSLPIGKDSVLMGSDTHKAFSPPVKAGTNISISINAENEAEAQKLFDGLSENGHIIMPLENTFWGALFGMFVDQFGIQWMVNYDYEQK